MGTVALRNLTSAAKADLVVRDYRRAKALRRPKAKSRSLHCAVASLRETTAPVGMTSSGVGERRLRELDA